MRKALHFLAHLLGFEKLSQYERDYLHNANLQGCIYIGFITIALEIWMLIRQSIARIIPKCLDGMDLFTALLKYTTKFWLLMLAGLALALFGLYYTIHKNSRMSRGWFLTLVISGSACILYTFILRLEAFVTPGDSITPVMASIMNTLLVSSYLCVFAIGLALVIYAPFRYLKNKRLAWLEHAVIITFSALGVAFGMYVSYSDFWDGKEILCFVMMMIYAGYLMIYRPYITIAVLTASFVGFFNILLTYRNGLSFQPKEVVINGVTYMLTSGDTANYLTYLISLITIYIAIYHGRLREAKDSRGIYRMFGQTAEALATAIDAKDKYTHGHSTRVADYSVKIARAMGKNEKECEKIYYAALLHDVGKIGVPDYIINKDGRLTDEEFAQIKLHPVHGNNILSRISESPYLSIGANYHHERYDGRGYPSGLKGDDIPEIARIIAVADAYDAMTSNRSYRSAIPQHIVKEELLKNSGTQFDPAFAKLMVQMIDHDVDYRMREGDNEASTGMRGNGVRHGFTGGWLITEEVTRMYMSNHPDGGASAEEALPSLIAFDSLDGKVHPGEEKNRDLLYYEYARIRMDGRVTEKNIRKSETRTLDIQSGLEQPSPESSGTLYRVDAIRHRDHALIRIAQGDLVREVILALPDNTRFLYLAICSEHSEVHNIYVKRGDNASEEQIPRIAEEISFIRGCPEGDIPNIEVDAWRTAATAGVAIADSMKLSFHAMSLPTARMIWHCPFISLFSSADGKVDGPDFREYMLLRLDGESWESDEHVENTVQVDLSGTFVGWNAWKEKNKQGIDCTVTIKRVRNSISMHTENLGVVVNSTTTILDDTKDVYIALTGDQCAITDIHISRGE